MSEIRYYGRCIIARETGLSPSRWNLRGIVRDSGGKNRSGRLTLKGIGLIRRAAIDPLPSDFEFCNWKKRGETIRDREPGLRNGFRGRGRNTSMPINAHDSFSCSLPVAWNFVKLYVRDVLLYLALVGGLLKIRKRRRLR